MDVDQVDELEWAATLEQTSLDKAVAEYKRLGMHVVECMHVPFI